jgi:hypothetical protein
MNQLFLEEYTIKLYGNCSVGIKEGVVRSALDFIPASSILGAAMSSYLFYECQEPKTCYQCNLSCPLLAVVSEMKKRRLSFTHFVPKMGQNSLKDYIIFWHQLAERSVLPKKNIHAHIGLNRLMKSVHQLEVEKGELRGLLYGDEIWTPPSNEFVGLVAAYSEDSLEKAKELLKFLDLTQLGGRSKYCFVELVEHRSIDVSSFLEDLEGKSDNFFIAMSGLALTGEEFKKISPEIRIISARFHVMKLDEITPSSSDYVSLYRMLSDKVDKVIFSTPMALVNLQKSDYSSEWTIMGPPWLELSPLGWNKLVPLSLVRKYEDEV